MGKKPIRSSLALGVEIGILGGPAGHNLLVVEDGAAVEAARGRRHPQLHGNRARGPLRHLKEENHMLCRALQADPFLSHLGIKGLEELADFRGLWQRRGSLVGTGRLL